MISPRSSSAGASGGASASRSAVRGAIVAMLASPQLARVLALASIGTAVLAFALQRTIGIAGLLGILTVLVVLAIAAFFARRDMVDWQGILPVSLLTFLGWAAISIAWSQYQWATLGSLIYLGMFTMLGIVVALSRDTIQIVRSYGDVLRVVLAASIVLEIFAGVLIDAPISFLGIDGNLDQFGPVQGLMGTRNEFGLLAVVAVVTFGTELRTRSVPKTLGIASLALAGISVALSRSPVVSAVFLVVALAIGALYLLRRVKPERRRFWQLSLLAAALVAAAIVWLARGRVVELLNATGALSDRLDIWQRIELLIDLKRLEGWGWIGPWRPDVQPFIGLANPSGTVPSGALNAYLDVFFQLGLVGVVIFVGMLSLAFVRSWLLAGRQRSIVFAWPALVLVALLTSALAESTLLTQWAWLTFVLCCVKAARELSWRKALRE